MMLLGLIASLFGCQSGGNDFKNDTITYFSLSEGGGMERFGGYRYEVEATKDGKVHFLFNEGYPDEKEFTIDDHSVFDSLQRIVMKHKMYRYKNYYQSPYDVLDGTSWGFFVQYASGKDIRSGGYMYGPDGYGAAISELCNCLDQWKNLPIAVNEVVLFRFEYGPEHYTIERKDDHAVLLYDNVETKEHRELERELEMLEDLRVAINVQGMKMNSKRGETKPDYTLWMYEINYNNGDRYLYESYDSSYESGYASLLRAFVTNWMKEKEERTRYFYY